MNDTAQIDERMEPVAAKLEAAGKIGIAVVPTTQPGGVMWCTTAIGYLVADISEEEEGFIDMFSSAFPDALSTSNIELCDLLMRQARERGFFLVLPASILAFIVHMHEQEAIA